MQNWKVLNRRLLLRTPWFALHMDRCLTPEGKVVPEYYTWQKRDCVIVFPITKEGKVLLIRQYRHGVRKVCIDYPGGTVEQGQSVLEAAAQELEEEAGYRSHKMSYLGGFFMDSSYSNQKVHFVIAFDCEKGAKEANPQEITEVIIVPFAQIGDFAAEHIECVLCSLLTVKAKRFVKERRS